ncbi:hypothetical protein MKW98_009254 [Papaver atlanticum]|uniref:Uncharacterized protein n=1 Tax=Papaver atlanticum TaxID=357466 RepID=A0AAD4T0W6_9MAGN|nr:hypothetical protein MKW98_009254 [Papaver atlanticum]
MEEEKAHGGENENEEIKYGGMKSMPFIIGNEIFEKIGFAGLTSNLRSISPVFNMKHVTAVRVLSIFQGTSAFTPLIGGYVADTYLGRYTTLGFAFLINLTGSILITLTAFITKLHPPKCGTNDKHICAEPTAPQWSLLICAFGFLVIGGAWIRPCSLAFGVDQFNPNNEAVKSSINSFINWYYFVVQTSFLVSLTLIAYVQSNLSWSIGLALSTCLSVIAVCIFFMGSRIYVKLKPEGSPVTSIIQVVVAATKKWELRHPENPEVSLFNRPQKSSFNSKLDYTNQLRFLDKSVIVMVKDRINTEDGTVANPWRLCEIQQVEEVKCLARVIPIWASLSIFQLASTLQLDRHIGKFEVPAASYLAIIFLSAFLWIPVYDRVIVPSLRKLTGNEGGITLLQRMGIGILLSILSMLISALVEERRRGIALTFPTLGITQNGGAISSMPGFWLIPQLTVIGLAEAFNSTAQIEFYYKQFPENMRSIGMSTYILGMSVGNYLCGFIVSIVHRTTEGASTGNWLPEDLNKGRLDYFYYMMTLVQLVNMLYFLVCSRWYRYKRTGSPTNAAEIEMDSRNVDKSSI